VNRLKIWIESIESIENEIQIALATNTNTKVGANPPTTTTKDTTMLTTA
jgi:hypothetical protein